MNDVLKKLLSYDAKKRQLFLLMLKQQGVDISELILPQERADGVFPVSFGQQRLWFLDQVEEEKAAYNEAFAITLDGELDVALLKQSFDVLCERHESLRTTFRMENGEVQQVIGEAQTVAFTLHDMRIYPDVLRQLEVDHLLHAERQTPFDLAAGPLWRVCLLQVGEQQHVLSLVLHHIICDATSNTVLYEELFTVYAALQSGRAWELPSVDLQYADYAVWQRNWLTGTIYQNQLAYWKKELSGAPSLLELPTDRPRPPVQSFRGSSWTMRLPKRLTADLHALGEREKSTMFTVLLAGFHVLLHRHSGQNDIVVGTPIGGRNRSEIERTIGFFANTQVMRAQIAEGDRFLDLLRLVKEKTLAAHEHQEFPFEKLVEELNPERDLSYSPLFQVMFTYLQVQNSESWRLPKLVAEMKKVDTGFVKFDLTFNLLEGSHGLQLHVEYNADLFAERTIERMAGHFQTLLEAIVTDPSGEV
ncbi:MAG: condensation domain-containing protein, partial [Tumebacillaceae bacterium]